MEHLRCGDGKGEGSGETHKTVNSKDDRSPVSTIVKSVKRAVAGEYSREFSAKVFNSRAA
jgi:hypothetical protein